MANIINKAKEIMMILFTHFDKRVIRAELTNVAIPLTRENIPTTLTAYAHET